MKKTTPRVLSLILGILLLCPLFTVGLGVLPASAVDDKTQFIFDALQVGDESISAEENGMALSLRSDATSFTAKEIDTVGAANVTNALYIRLVNRSNATVLRVDYDYFLDEPGSATVYHTLESSDVEQVLLLKTPNISNRQEGDELVLSFECNGAPTGSVTLLSCFDVTVYDGAEITNNDAFFTTCTYDAEEHVIKITGEVSVSATMRYEGATLALFALSPEDRDFYLFSKTDVARTEVGQTFSFSVKAETAEEIFARYLVAVVTKSGERIPLCAPVYPDLPSTASTQAEAFKGYHTESLFSAIDSGAKVEIVDVYMDRMNTTQNSDNAILYAGDHEYYYFDRSEIVALDHRVRNLKGAGFTVYLRFLVSAEANGLSYVTHTDNPSGIYNKGIDIKDENALLDVYAITDFLTERYGSTEIGRIDGIIIGRSADRSLFYFYMGNQALDAYAEKYASLVYLIAGGARLNIPGLDIVVPISDRASEGGIATENLAGDYFSDLFLLSLLSAIDDVTLNPTTLSLMVESHQTPALVDEGDEDTYYGTDRLDRLIESIKGSAPASAFLSSDILYSWMPHAALDEDKLIAAYALQYITLISRNDVRSFIVDLSLLEESAEKRVAQALQYAITNIDTSKNVSVLQEVFATLDVSPTTVFPGYDPALWQSVAVIKGNMKEGKYAAERVPKGSYNWFSFSSTTDLLGWYAGNACGDPAVVNHALTAAFAPTSDAEYAEIAYHFDGERDLSLAPLMRFSLKLIGEENTPYEVQIRLRCATGVIVTSAVIMSGEAHEFYLDLSSSVEHLKQVGSVRVMARPLRADAEAYTLCLNHVKLESTTLTEKELADLLAVHDDMEIKPEDKAEERDLTVPILVSALILLLSLALVAFLIVKHHRDARNDKKTINTENSDEQEKR